MHYPKPSPDEARACSHHAERVDSGRLGHLDATPALARVLGAISRCALSVRLPAAPHREHRVSRAQ